MRDNSPYGQIHVKYDDYSAHDPEPIEEEPVVTPITWRERFEIILTAGIIGLCVLVFHYAGDPIVDFIAETPIADYYNESQAVYMAVQIFYSLVTILLPFAVGGFFLQRIHDERDLLPLHKPNSAKNLAFSLGIGFVALVISNYITTFFVLGAEHFGIFFETGDVMPVKSVPDFLWQILGTAIVPALVEEFAVRGVIMQSLRKYGDILAIAVSAVLFALLHGNMVQAPFALVLGCVLGWLVIVTDSLWTGILIHFMNNSYAVIMNTAMEFLPEHIYVIVFLLINAVGVVLGVMAFFRIDNKYKRMDAFYEPGGNTDAARMSYRTQGLLLTFLSPPMAAAVVVLIMQLVERVHLIGW